MSKKESHPCAGCGECLISVDIEQCMACEDRDAERRQAWVAFCAAAMKECLLISDVAKEADEALNQYDARFPKRRK